MATPTVTLDFLANQQRQLLDEMAEIVRIWRRLTPEERQTVSLALEMIARSCTP